MRLEFASRHGYSQYASIEYYPLVAVTLFNGSFETQTYALLDSGADTTLFHASIGEDLGLDIRLGERSDMSGITNDRRIDVYTHQVRLVVENYDLGFVDLDFSYEIGSHWTDNLLGRFPVFDALVVAFRQRKTPTHTSPGWSYLSVNR